MFLDNWSVNNLLVFEYASKCWLGLVWSLTFMIFYLIHSNLNYQGCPGPWCVKHCIHVFDVFLFIFQEPWEQFYITGKLLESFISSQSGSRIWTALTRKTIDVQCIDSVQNRKVSSKCFYVVPILNITCDIVYSLFFNLCYFSEHATD